MPNAFNSSQIKSALGWSNSFDRDAAYPLDKAAWFGSYEAAAAAAQTAVEVGSTASKYYFGMPIFVFDGTTASQYQIQGDKSLKEVGSATLGDEKSIALEDGVLSLKNFGKKYWAYQAGEDGSPGTYTETDGWTAPLEPKVRLVSEGVYELAWYQPNPTTVEGLQSAISDLQATVGNMYQKTDVYNKTEIDGMLEWGTIE